MRNVSRPWRLVVVLTVLVCAIAIAGWLVTAHRTVEKVSSSWALRCDDSRGRSVAVQKIEVRASWRCAVDLRVSNASSHTVRVRQVGMPLAGTTSRLMRAQSTSTARAQNANHGTGDARFGDRDAVYAFDLAVPARASRTLSLPVAPERGTPIRKAPFSAAERCVSNRTTQSSRVIAVRRRNLRVMGR